MPLQHPDPVWILDNNALAHYCLQWLEQDAIALDTEFIRTDTFYPKPGLIQLGTGSEVFLIDPLSVDNWEPFAKVLSSASVTKVLHACGEDLEVFHILTGVKPVSMADTQLLAAYAGLGHSLSYQNLLKALLDINLPKDATRSNWLQRPLTESQISYASLDVVHLLEAYSLLLEKLEEKPQLQWALEDCRTVTEAPLQPDPSEVWKGVKRAWQLYPDQLVVLQQVCEYREKEARKRNIPRSRVIPNGSLWPIARYLPDNIRSLSSIQDMTPKVIRKDGEILLNLIQQAKTIPAEQHPERLPPPLPKVARDYGKFIKSYVQEKSDELKVPVELILPGKMTSPILRHWLEHKQFALPAELNGWRRTVIGEPLILALNSYDAPKKASQKAR